MFTSRKQLTGFQTRRQVQRRFPPGAFVVFEGTQRLATIVGWCQTPPTYKKNGELRTAMGWEAVLIWDCRVINVSWERMRDHWTLEEWEQG